MALFLQILEGETPATAKPVVATRDQAIIASVSRALVSRLNNGAAVLELAGASAPKRRRSSTRKRGDNSGG